MKFNIPFNDMDLEIKSGPLLIKKYIEYKDNDYFNILLNELGWLAITEPRKEYFMTDEVLSYTYSGRTYESKSFHSIVKCLMNNLNTDFDTEYNVCFLNYYEGQHNHLGWHADDSEHMNLEHPIAVVSFGAEREIWCKPKDFKGEIPHYWKYKLPSNSLFIMPEFFQIHNVHRIPKCDQPCGGRISLTYRNYIK